MKEISIVAGVFLMGYALRTFYHPLFRKIGFLAYQAGVFLAGYYLLGSVWGGVAFLMGLALIPLIEILFRVRQLRLPMKRQLRKTAGLPGDTETGLQSVSKEIREQEFCEIDDLAWQHEYFTQYLRLFFHVEKRCQAVFHLHEQGEILMTFVSLTSRLPDGRQYMTWNNPLAHSLKDVPQKHLQRCEDATSFEELLASHEDWLLSHGVKSEDCVALDAEALVERLDIEFAQQLDWNVEQGILEPSGEGFSRYSLRGCMFLYGRSLRDFIRLS